MRRLLPLLLIVVLLIVFVTAVSMAQDDPAVDPIIDGRTMKLDALPGVMIDGVAGDSYSVTSFNEILSLSAEDPSDSCEEAPDIALIPEAPADGVSFDVRNATSANDDPILSCMWGDPPRQRGFRTVWYRLVVPASGRISLDTFSSAYDTVLGVFRGECGALVPVQCSDDFNGFSSGTILPATAGEIYYIEVASWQPGVPETPTLNLSAILRPLQSLWDTLSTNPGSPAISRHSTVALGDKLYVLGGQTGGEGVPTVSNQVLRLNTSNNNNWKTLAQIPGAGYSNTTAALVGDHIYIPSGYNGNALGYDGFHWSFRIPTDADDLGTWDLVKNVPRPNGKTFAWSASAVPPSNDRYYLMGGTSSTELFNTATVSNAEAYVYFTGTNEWLQIPSMQTGRYAHTGSWVSTNSLGACVAGGLGVLPTGAFVFHTSAECYHPAFGWRYIGDMNIPRIGAGSVTGPDGRWYVFGGLTAVDETTLLPVLQTEVYDPRQGTWTILPPEYNLGAQQIGSARAFTSGAIIGNDLYVTGGSIFVNGEQAVPLTEKISIPPVSMYLPSVVAFGENFLLPDDSFEQAKAIAFDFTYKGNFSSQRDFYDFYSFDLYTTTEITINLEVPDNNDFDLYLYGQNKLEWAHSASPFQGEDESINIVLEPRRYYAMVQRSFPTSQPDQGATYNFVVKD